VILAPRSPIRRENFQAGLIKPARAKDVACGSRGWKINVWITPAGININ